VQEAAVRGARTALGLIPGYAMVRPYRQCDRDRPHG
jgi:hypothetical protein